MRLISAVANMLPTGASAADGDGSLGPLVSGPGIKLFSAVTATLKSRIKRQVIGKPVGIVWTAQEWMRLYAESETAPIPPPSEAERQASREERRCWLTCQDFRRVMPQVSDLDGWGYCAACAATG